eukprot:scaffold4071_cov217-Isochrysis_galbana.AAC.3
MAEMGGREVRQPSALITAGRSDSGAAAGSSCAASRPRASQCRRRAAASAGGRTAMNEVTASGWPARIRACSTERPSAERARARAEGGRALAECARKLETRASISRVTACRPAQTSISTSPAATCAATDDAARLADQTSSWGCDPLSDGALTAVRLSVYCWRSTCIAASFSRPEVDSHTCSCCS